MSTPEEPGDPGAPPTASTTPDDDAGASSPGPAWRPETPEAWGGVESPPDEWRPEDPSAWERARAPSSGGSGRRIRLRRSSAHRDRIRRSSRRPVPLSAMSPSSGRRGSGRSRTYRPHRRLKLVVVVLGFLAVGLGAVLADAYYQSYRIYQDARAVLPNLTAARNALARGEVPAEGPNGDPLDVAARVAGRAQDEVDGARFTFRLAGAIPLLGRPVQAVRRGVEAAGEEAFAAGLMRDMVGDVLGDTALPGPGGTQPAGETPIFQNGMANVDLISGLTPRLENVIRHLQVADGAIRAIPDVPFVPRVAEIRAEAMTQSGQAIRLAQDALSGVRLLPSFFGVDGPRTYLLALENNAELRGTGGAVLAYAFIEVEAGKLRLVGQGGIGEIDRKHVGYPAAALTAPVRWYLDNAPQPPNLYPRIPDTSFSPDFPSVARAWTSIVKEATGKSVDGVIAMDPFAVSSILGRGTIHVPAYPKPIRAGNLVEVTESAQYQLAFRDQQAFPGQLIGAAWKLLSNPDPFVRTVKQLGKAFDQRHLQIWAVDPGQEALLERLGWDGSVDPGPGDFLYPVDNQLRGNKVHFYTHTAVDYRVRVDESGGIRSTATITLTNATPAGLPPQVVTNNSKGYALDQSLIAVYVPRAAVLRSADPEAGPPNHAEAGAMVFVRDISLKAGETRSAAFTYTVPNVVQVSSGGRAYVLSIQRQALANPATLSVTVTFPEGSVPDVPAGWTVKGNVASYSTTLVTDLDVRITF